MKKAEKWVFFGEMPPFLRIVSGCENFFDRIFSGNVRFMFGYFKRIRSQSCQRGFLEWDFQEYDMSMMLLSHLSFVTNTTDCPMATERVTKKTGAFGCFGSQKHLSKGTPVSHQLFKVIAQ